MRRFALGLAVVAFVGLIGFGWWALSPEPPSEGPLETSNPRGQPGEASAEAAPALELESAFERALEAGAATLEVVVLGQGRGPLPGALVRAEAGGESRQARTDEAGIARFEGLHPKSELQVEAGFADFVSARQTLVLRAGANQARLALAPSLQLRGVVLDFEAEPAEEVALSVDGEPAGQTGTRGRFRLAVALGARVQASHPDKGTDQLVVTEQTMATGFVVMRLAPAALRAETSRAIVGRVSDVDGPVEAARIRARAGHGYSFTGTTDPSGAFVVPVQGDGPFSVSAMAPDGRQARAEGARPGASVQLQLSAAGRIEGQVESSDGQPVGAFELRYGQDGSPPASRAMLADAEGGFSLEPVDPGTYTVEVRTADGATASLRGVEVPEGGSAWVSLALAAPASVFGVVRDAESGAPIAEAVVGLGGQAGLWTPPSTRSDAEGRFELTPIPSGRRSVRASAQGRPTQIVSGLVLAPGQREGPVEIQMGAGGSGFELVGIGAMLSVVDGALEVRGVVPGGGALGSGIRVGDRITAIDGESVDALGFDAAIQAIRGRAGTTVQLSLQSGDSEKILTVTRTRVRS